MKAMIVGSGAVGSAVQKVLKENGHEVVAIGRRSGDFQADISDIGSLKSVFEKIGSFDAVACAAGECLSRPAENDHRRTVAGLDQGQGTK